MRRRTTLGFVCFGNSAPSYLELTDVVLKDARGNRYHSRPIIRCGAGTRLDISKVGRRTGLRTQAKKENVYASERIKLLEVKLQASFQISRVGLHRRKTLHLFEERVPKQPLKVSHEAKTVIHLHWRQGILGKYVKPVEK